MTRPVLTKCRDEPSNAAVLKLILVVAVCVQRAGWERNSPAKSREETSDWNAASLLSHGRQPTSAHEVTFGKPRDHAIEHLPYNSPLGASAGSVAVLVINNAVVRARGVKVWDVGPGTARSRTSPSARASAGSQRRRHGLSSWALIQSKSKVTCRSDAYHTGASCPHVSRCLRHSATRLARLLVTDRSRQGLSWRRSLVHATSR
jgi:hypothetical protein